MEAAANSLAAPTELAATLDTLKDALRTRRDELDAVATMLDSCADRLQHRVMVSTAATFCLCPVAPTRLIEASPAFP